MAYSSVTVFGDSLVDAGNVLRLADWYDGLPFTDPIDAAPTADKGYYDGRFTNGFTYADLISNKYIGQVTKPIFPYGYEDPYIGIRISPFSSDPSGNNLNFAYGGAQMHRGEESVPDIDGQTDAWRDAVDGDADPNGLYLFSFGANDVHDLVPMDEPWADLATAQQALEAAASEFIHEISGVIRDGARNILVTGVPDIGVQPYYNGAPDEAERRAVATQYAHMLDEMVRTGLSELQQSTGVEIHYVSFEAMADYVLDEMTQIYGSGAIYPLNTSSLVFFDKAHPTTQMHALAAAYLIDQLKGTPAGDQMKLAAPDFSQSGSIATAGEVRTIVVSLAANTTYTVQMLGLSSLGGDVTVLADPQLRVLGPSGTFFASNDDGGMGLDASLTFRTGAAGDYTIELSAVGSLTGSFSFLAEGAALGNNTYIVSHSSALILERAGEGSDTVQASVSYVLAPGVSVEKLTTNSASGLASIDLTGNEFGQTITGNAGVNALTGAGGNDVLNGGAGNDRLDGGTGADQLNGGGGNDTLLGGAGNDKINGNAGGDSMSGGAGNDSIFVDNVGDSVTENLNEGTDTVSASISWTLGANVERLVLTGSANSDGTGNELGNNISGNAGANHLYGMAGSDALNGGAGNDWIEGGAGRDVISGGTGADQFVFRGGDFGGTTTAACDVIRDFISLDGDRINLQPVDANALVGGDQAFTLIGTSAFDGHTAGQLRYEVIGGNTYVQGDTNGDGVADFWIQLDGLHTLSSADFDL